jgi:hypothetical protein
MATKPPFMMKSAAAKKAAPAGKMCPGCKNPACKKAGKCMKGK